jgi:hypothetical protein
MLITDLRCFVLAGFTQTSDNGTHDGKKSYQPLAPIVLTVSDMKRKVPVSGVDWISLCLSKQGKSRLVGVNDDTEDPSIVGQFRLEEEQK